MLSPDTGAGDWREVRRRSSREAIVAAAWDLVAESGLAGPSIREIAKRAGITTPTVYAYFQSKHDIYDAMFGQAAAEFVECMARPFVNEDPRSALAEGAKRFAHFCVENVPRYQLLFQRTIPGFQPSATSFEPAIRALALTHERLALNGVTDPRLRDMWTGITTGLVDQQISNDPGGDRWIRLIEDYTDMFLAFAKKQQRS
jgi:AcrR family transcriptional regulator